MSLGDRFIHVLDILDISGYQAAQDLGSSGTVISKIKGGRTPSSKLLERMILTYGVNANWLMTGEGEVFNNKAKEHFEYIQDKFPPAFKKVQELSLPPFTGDPLAGSEIITIEQKESTGANVLVMDAKAAAGWPSNIGREEFFDELPQFQLPLFRTGDMVLLQTRGDSMEPTIYNGDWLCLSRVLETKDIQDGYVHVVLLDSGLVVKRVLNRLAKRSSLALKSDNDAYPTYDVKVNEVLQVWKVEMKFSAVLKNPKDEIKEELGSLRKDIDMVMSQMITWFNQQTDKTEAVPKIKK